MRAYQERNDCGEVCIGGALPLVGLAGPWYLVDRTQASHRGALSL